MAKIYFFEIECISIVQNFNYWFSGETSLSQLDDVVDGSNPSFWVTVEEDESSKYNNAIYVGKF